MSGKMKENIDRIKEVMMNSNIRRPGADLTTLEEYLAKMNIISELCTFIDNQNDNFYDRRQDKKMPMNDYLKGEILKIVLELHDICEGTKKNFTEQILHREGVPGIPFDAVNIMTLFVVGLLQVGSGTFTDWIHMAYNDDDFCKYVRSFLLNIVTPSYVFIHNSKSEKDGSEKPDRPADDSKIPSTLCITDSKNVISISRVKKNFVLDVLDDQLPWNLRVQGRDTITSLVPLWYVYVLWVFRDDDEKTGCYGVNHDQNCYFFAYNLTGTGVSDLDVEERKHELIEVPYQAYTSCIQKVEFTPEEIVSKLDSTTFKFNMLLYIHLLVLGYFNNEKIIFYACHEYDQIIQDALLAGKTYGDFYNKLTIAGEGLMIESTPDDDVIEALAIAHLDLMEDKDYYFSSDVPRSVTRTGKDRFITTCPVDYQWVFENERLKDCGEWKTKMITLIQKVSTGRGSFKDVGIIRRIIDCIPEKDSYDEDTSELFKIFSRPVDIGTKVKTSDSDNEEKYIVFDFEKYGKEHNLFHTGSGIDQFCHNELYKKAMEEYFQYPSIHPHFNDFKNKYVVWNQVTNTFYVRDSSQMYLVRNKPKRPVLDSFPFCPFCKDEKVGYLHRHIKTKHNQELNNFDLELVVNLPIEQKKLDAPGGKTPIKFGEGGDAEGTSGTDGAVDASGNINTPGNLKTPDTAKSTFSVSSENDRKFEEDLERRNLERIERLKKLKDAQDPTQPTTDSEPGSPRAAGGSNQKGRLEPIARVRSEAAASTNKTNKNDRPASAGQTRPATIFNKKFDQSQPSANPPPPDGGAAAETDAVADSGRASPTGSTADSQKTTDAGVTSSVVGSTEGTPRPAWPDDVQEDMPDPVTPTPTPDPMVVDDGTSRKSRPSTAKRTQATRTTFVESEESPRDGGEGEIEDLKVSNKTTQGNDQNVITELQEKLNIHRRIQHDKREKIQSLENEKNELIALNEGLRNDIKDLNQTIQQMTEAISTQSQEHATKIQALSGEKDKEIAELKIQLTQTTSQEIKALGLAKDALERQNDGIKQQITDNKALLESIKREIKDNERKKDQNMTKIDEQIDAMYDMDIDDLDLKYLLQDDQGNHDADNYVEFKKIVLDEHPVKEMHSLCALFLMYESMAGTWKAFVEQRALNKIDNVVIQKLMHELRLYSSIGNHNATVKGLVSKHFKEFVEEFKLEAGAGATVAEQVQSVQAVAGSAPASVEPEADASEEPAAPASEEPEVDASAEEAAPASEEPEVDASEEPAASASEEPEVDASEEPEIDASEEPVAATGDPGVMRAI